VIEMMIGQMLLIGAIQDVLFALVPIVFFVIYVLNHLLSAKGNQQQQRNVPKRPPQRGERPMRPAPPQAGQPQGPAAQLNAEIEQFLKRAGQRRGEKAPAQQQQRSTRTAGPPPAPKAPPKVPVTARREAPREQPIDVMPIESHRLSTVAESVAQHLDQRKFSQRAEHLAEEVAHADEQMEAHLEQVFSHQVGTLGAGGSRSLAPSTDAPAKPAAAASRAAAYAQLLGTRQGMKQAIVLQEILARPEQRW
jgi:hypothetical protein